MSQEMASSSNLFNEKNAALLDVVNHASVELREARSMQEVGTSNGTAPLRQMI